MKKTYIAPAIKSHKINAATILAGSNEPNVFGSSAEENSEGLSKGSSFCFDYDSDDDE